MPPSLLIREHSFLTGFTALCYQRYATYLRYNSTTIKLQIYRIIIHPSDRVKLFRQVKNPAHRAGLLDCRGRQNFNFHLLASTLPTRQGLRRAVAVVMSIIWWQQERAGGSRLFVVIATRLPQHYFHTRPVA